jgi:hypothetical protein
MNGEDAEKSVAFASLRQSLRRVAVAAGVSPANSKHRSRHDCLYNDRDDQRSNHAGSISFSPLHRCSSSRFAPETGKGFLGLAARRPHLQTMLYGHNGNSTLQLDAM